MPQVVSSIGPTCLGKSPIRLASGFPWTNHRKFAIFTLVIPLLECWDLGKTWDQTAIIPTQPLLAPLTPYQIWSAFSALMIRINARFRQRSKKTSSHPMTSWISCVWAFKTASLRLPKRPTRRRLSWHLIMRAKSQQRVASRSCLFPTFMPWTEDSPTMVGCRNVRIPLPN